MFRKSKVPASPTITGLYGYVHLDMDRSSWSYNYKFGHILSELDIHPSQKLSDPEVRLHNPRKSEIKLSLMAEIRSIRIIDNDKDVDENPGLRKLKGGYCNIEIEEIESTEDSDGLQRIGGGIRMYGSNLTVSIAQTREEINDLLLLSQLNEHSMWTTIDLKIEQLSMDKKISANELMNRFAVNWIEISTLAGSEESTQEEN